MESDQPLHCLSCSSCRLSQIDAEIARALAICAVGNGFDGSPSYAKCFRSLRDGCDLHVDQMGAQLFGQRLGCRRAFKEDVTAGYGGVRQVQTGIGNG